MTGPAIEYLRGYQLSGLAVQRDANSAAVVRTLHAATGVLLTSTFAELEVVNALGLRVFRKEVRPNCTQR